MLRNVASALNKIQEDLERQQKKLEYLKENMSCLEYWEDCGDGGSWKPFTEDVALYDNKWNVDQLRVNLYYLVNTDYGINIFSKEEYECFRGEKTVLCQGSYQDCKNYIKI